MVSVGLLPIAPFPGQNIGWKSQCLKCGSVVAPHFSTIAAAIKAGIKRSCSKCGANRAIQKRKEAYFSRLPDQLAELNFELIGTYLDAKTSTTFRCTLCSKETKSTSDSILRGDKKCDCQKKPRRPISEFFPLLAEELAGDFNGRLTAEQIGTGMRSSVWWRCKEKGHLFDASPANRVRGSGCRFCLGMAAYPGESDLETSHPELCLELAAEQPEGVSAKTLMAGSSVIANWVCAKNAQHIYPSSPYERIERGAGCSYCAGKRVLQGDNDLVTKNREVAAEWDYEKNFPQRPEFFTPGSNKEFNWKCSWNPQHSWKATINTRTKGHGCNMCARVKAGVNDLFTMARRRSDREALLSEWDYELNTKKPDEVAYSDNDEYWWKCAESLHPSYSAKCSNRWFSYTGCPTCAPSAYSSSKPGRFYFLSNAELKAFKVGITNVSSKTDRLKRFQGHGWTPILSIDHNDGLLIRNLEKRILYIIRQVWNLPPFLEATDMRKLGGSTETFTSDFASAEDVASLVQFELNELLARGMSTSKVGLLPQL